MFYLKNMKKIILSEILRNSDLICLCNEKLGSGLLKDESKSWRLKINKKNSSSAEIVTKQEHRRTI